jgi:membrane protease YdiL (CAAX protease family)
MTFSPELGDATEYDAVLTTLLAPSASGAFSAMAAFTSVKVVLVAPVLEETFFRGFLLPTLTRWLTPPAAVAAAAAAFAAAHVAPPAVTAQAFAGGLVFGGALLAARGNLAAPIIAHACYNALEVASAVAAAAAVAGEG